MNKSFTLVLLASFLCGSALAQNTTAPAATCAPLSVVKKLQDFAGLHRYATADAALPSMEAGRVVFFGDSITDHWSKYSTTFFPGKPYLNRGISGQTTEQMVIRFRQDVIDLHPAAVLILAGTNDIAGNTGPSTPEMIEGNLESMVQLARANHIRVILASLTPAFDYPWKRGMDPAPKIKALNAWIKEYCAQQKITYLDYYSPMVDAEGGMKPGISIDGVHPNAEGYAIMEPLAEAAIEKTLKN